MSFDLNYTISGTGEPFIFQHGLGANLQQPQGLLSDLENVQLISMDCRGHGQSTLPESYPPSFENYTDDVLRLMDYLGIEQATFGGISMGAGISMNMAIRYPDRVKTLVLVRPAWLEKGNPANLEILLKIIPFLSEVDGQKRFEKTADFQAVKTILPKAANSILGQFSRDQGKFTAKVLKHMVGDAPYQEQTDLAKIQKACLIIANDDDPLHPYDFAAKIQESIPNSKLKKVTSRYIDNELHKRELTHLVSSFLDGI